MEKTPWCVQAILGTMWAGAAYVPLDPRTTWRRCRTIASDCFPTAWVVDAAHLSVLSDVLAGIDTRLVLVDCDEGDRLAQMRSSLPTVAFESLQSARSASSARDPLPGPDDLAYILYTSGSTGTPKGVAHTHGSGLSFTCWVQKTFGVVPEDVFSSHAPFHFDLSISDLYASLGIGASVHLISTAEAMLAPYLVRQVPKWDITIWYSVPSILIAMLDIGELENRGFGHVHTLFFAGETFPTPQLRRLRLALPQTRLFNLFGPTETNVCTYYEIPPDIAGDEVAPIPIGRACENLETWVMDDLGRELGVGEVGTLWVRGGNLMQGYWNDAERTAKMLAPDPLGRPGFACNTGDRVRLRPDGNYDFLGRRDHMIKTRGYRVELGEIEYTICLHPSVLEAVASALPDSKVGNRIVASVVPRAGQVLDPKELRAFCGSHLPTYMVPDEVETLDALPRTSTGKVDREKLRSDWQRRSTS